MCPLTVLVDSPSDSQGEACVSLSCLRLSRFRLVLSLFPYITDKCRTRGNDFSAHAAGTFITDAILTGYYCITICNRTSMLMFFISLGLLALLFVPTPASK